MDYQSDPICIILRPWWGTKTPAEYSEWCRCINAGLEGWPMIPCVLYYQP